MLKDGPLLSLKLGYLSKFQSSSNQDANKKSPDLPTCVPGAVRWASVRSGDFVLPWRPNEENQERDAQTGRTALYKGQSLSSRFILAQLLRLVKQGRNRAVRI